MKKHEKNVVFFLILLLVFIITGCGKKDAKDMIELIVKGESMEDSLFEGEKVLIDKETTAFLRYDIMAFVSDGTATEFRNAPEQEYYIKRVYGLPGDTIRLKIMIFLLMEKRFKMDMSKIGWMILALQRNL